MMEEKFAPLGNASASDIRNISSSGLVLPIRRNDPPLLVFPWGEGSFALKLAGDDAFGYFPISLKTPYEGVFLPDVEIMIDFASLTTGRGHQEHKGILILEKDKLSVMGIAVGNAWADCVQVPLWMEVNGGSDDAKAAFTRWAVGLKVGNDYRIMWSHEFEPNSE